jgi:hypothetical protein
MVVEIDTPQGLRTGSAVREIRYSKPSGPPSIGESRPQWRIKGQAVAVDLPGGRTLFALLTNARNDPEYAARLPYDHMGWLSDEGMSRGPVELWPKIPFKPHHNREILGPAYLPMLITFRDIDDPKSVEAVEPEALESAFGPGVRLRRITAQRTNEAVTTGIEKRLPWLEQNGLQRSTLIPNPPRLLKDATPIQLISAGDFSTELFR